MAFSVFTLEEKGNLNGDVLKISIISKNIHNKIIRAKHFTMKDFLQKRSLEYLRLRM